MPTKLIILRGPSGAGKSTIAKQLQKDGNREILLIEQDYYRNSVLGGKPDDKNIVPKLIFENAFTILNAGYDLIIEGIFRKEKYLPMFEKLIAGHTENNFVFYFDVSFEETVTRHSTRSKAAEFGSEEMAAWYHMAEPLHIPYEQIIPQEFTVEQSLKLIQEKAGI